MVVNDGRVVITSGNTVTLSSGKTCTVQPGTGLDGGAFLVEVGGLLAGSTDTFFSNSAKNGGAVCNKGKTSLSEAFFGGNFSSNDGGALWNSGTADLSNGTDFRGNTASNGGAIFNTVSGKLDFAGEDAVSNNIAELGGALWNGGTANFNGSVVLTGNKAAQGGAVYNVASGILNFKTDSNFFRNQATGNGGGLYNAGNAVFNGMSLMMNSSSADGGALYNAASGIVVFQNDDLFTKNEVSGNGGAVYNSGTVTFTGTTFSGNTAASGNGGAIFNANDGVLFLSGSNAFSKNKALQGGALYNAGIVNITGSVALLTAGDTIYNTGTLNIDLTGGTAAYGSIANYQYLSNSGGTLTITVNAAQEAGNYIIASGIGGGLSGKESFTLTGAAGLTDVVITVDGGTEEYGDSAYALTKFNDTLLLSVSGVERFFYSSSWTTGQAVNVSWHGKNYYGTVGDGTFFNDYTGAVTAADGQSVIVMENGTISKSVHYDASNAILSGTSAVYNRMILGGKLLSGNNSYEGSYSLAIEDGTFNSEVAGGDAGNQYVDRTGNISFSISGGTFNGNVLGGGYYAGKDLLGYYVLEGDINFTISGGSFAKRVYGGNGAMTEATSSLARMAGNVYLTIDASSNAISFGENVAAGNRGKGLLFGSTNVTVSGLGSNLNFAENSVLFGGCGGDCYVTSGGVRRESTSVIDPVSISKPGKRNLSFDNFSGSFDAEIRMFSDVSFINGTDMNFADAKLNLKDVSTWNFDCTSFAGNLNQNEFTGDIINIDTANLIDSWTLLSGGAAAFDDLSAASQVKFNGSSAACVSGVWTDGNYSLFLDESGSTVKLVVSKLG